MRCTCRRLQESATPIVDVKSADTGIRVPLTRRRDREIAISAVCFNGNDSRREVRSKNVTCARARVSQKDAFRVAASCRLVSQESTHPFVKLETLRVRHDLHSLRLLFYFCDRDMRKLHHNKYYNNTICTRTLFIKIIIMIINQSCQLKLNEVIGWTKYKVTNR